MSLRIEKTFPPKYSNFAIEWPKCQRELTCEPVDILIQREPVALRCDRLPRASMAAFRRRLRTSYPAAVHPHAAFRRKDFAEPFIAPMEIVDGEKTVATVDASSRGNNSNVARFRTAIQKSNRRENCMTRGPTSLVITPNVLGAVISATLPVGKLKLV